MHDVHIMMRRFIISSFTQPTPQRRPTRFSTHHKGAGAHHPIRDGGSGLQSTGLIEHYSRSHNLSLALSVCICLCLRLSIPLFLPPSLPRSLPRSLPPSLAPSLSLSLRKHTFSRSLALSDSLPSSLPPSSLSLSLSFPLPPSFPLPLFSLILSHSLCSLLSPLSSLPIPPLPRCQRVNWGQLSAGRRAVGRAFWHRGLLRGHGRCQGASNAKD